MLPPPGALGSGGNVDRGLVLVRRPLREGSSERLCLQAFLLRALRLQVLWGEAKLAVRKTCREASVGSLQGQSSAILTAAEAKQALPELSF